MSHVPHDLAEGLPEHAARPAERRGEAPHLARLSDDDHLPNREIHRAEINVRPMERLALEALKKRRLALADEIRGLPAAA
ncbi:YdcH family protein [uncultured Albimonas sp.]|uniref:YdcH family protein n=1 Tax=uncultured Albimonas sp. TaxID=1331701 RepID=UPI0030EDFA93|tara:strand:- start:5319 stop:5558 length:240 start_codon:yes stop_codon:yes gene_type:complete